MRSEAVAQYLYALKLGQKYYQTAVAEGFDRFGGSRSYGLVHFCP